MKETTKMLIEKWIEATLFMSSPTQMKEHALFKAISKREDAVGALIETLKEKECIQTIIGLSELTEVNPVHREHRGYVSKMRQDWLDWADKKSS